MKHLMDGFILLTTLLMIIIFTILILAMMQAVHLNYKMSHQFIDKHQAFYQLESMADKIANNLNAYKNCFTSVLEPNQISANLVQKKGCVLEQAGINYHYLLVDLGHFPCLITLKNGVQYDTHQWLINILHPNLPSEVLQLRVASPEKLAHCDSSITKQIKQGVMSWRYYD